MGRPCNSTCSLCFNLPLCYLTAAGSSDPAGASRGEGAQGAEQSCSSPGPAGTAAEKLCPAAYTNGNAAHPPHVGRRPLLTYRTDTFSLSLNNFPLNNKIMNTAGSSFA